ncbi:MAG: protein-L-isoaspartate O-methyltransferase [Steroidobacterales bacterium]|jgi:protein-L-isoaspartate(D-aspartate) O-methyltransferase
MRAASVSEQMIEQQVRAWDVLDERVLDAMRDVPRAAFAPESQRFRAYADAEVPLGEGQHMLRPSVAGRILQELLPQPGESVLEVGTGSGFLTACLRRLSARVRSLEIFPTLAAQARTNLAALAVPDVEIVVADALDAAELRAAAAGRYPAIAVTASLPLYDERFEELLSVGGRLLVVVGEWPVMEARLVRRTAEDRFTSEGLFETVIDPLIHAARRPEFTF